MKGLKTFYICTECEYKTPKWMGKCPKCGAWNSFTEDVEEIAPAPTIAKRVSMIPSGDNHAVGFQALEIPEYMRQNTGLNELDRVLGCLSGCADTLDDQHTLGQKNIFFGRNRQNGAFHLQRYAYFV